MYQIISWLLMVVVSLQTIQLVKADTSSGSKSYLKGLDDHKSEFQFNRILTGQNLEKIYDQLDSHLITRVKKGENMETNIKEAQNWLLSKLHKGSQFPAKAISQVLRQLKLLQNKPKCDKEGYVNLINNNLAVRNKISSPDWILEDSKRRIDSLIRHYTERYAFTCLHVYPTKFDEKYRVANSLLLERVATLANGVIRGELIRMTLFGDKKERDRLNWQFVTTEQIKNMLSRQQPETILAISNSNWMDELNAHDALEYLARNDPDRKFLRTRTNELTGKAVVQKDKIKELLRKYLVQPCDYYIRTFGPEVFIPATYESSLIDPERKTKEEVLGLIDYYIGMASYRICRNLVKQTQSRKNPLCDSITKIVAGYKRKSSFIKGWN